MTTDAEFAQLREQIDQVDDAILELIARRVRLVLAVGDYKRQRRMEVYDPERERSLLNRLALRAVPPLEAGTVRRIFERLVDESRRIEQRHVQRGE